MSRITQLMMDVVNRYLLVIDADQLRQSLESHGLRYRKDQPPECWAYDLLRQTKGRFARLADLGLSKLPEIESLSNNELWGCLHHEFLTISEAHYERYFRQPLAFD